MAKLYFYYSSMNAGKSTALLQSSYNYRERGMNTLVLTPHLDDRYGIGKVTSRIGLEANATSFRSDADLYELISARNDEEPLNCVLLDEAQFLTKEQVFQLGEVTDELDIPVLAYGIRTDFQGEPFPGSKYLLAWADNLKELKAICFCGNNEIGGNDRYVSMCRKHFKENYFRQTLVPQHQLPLSVVGGDKN
jgi:thymidine kinase